MSTDQYSDGTYLEKVGDWHTGDAKWKASKVLEMIEKHELSFSSVYDVGCGAGEILVQLQQRIDPAVELMGFDISPQAIAMAKTKENARLKFFVADYNTASVAPPDLLLLLDVFEHVPDYLGFLETIREKSDWVIFHIPLDIGVKALLKKSKYMMEMQETYGHLHFFTKETAIAAIDHVGFRIVDYCYTDDFEEMLPNTFKSRMNYELRKLIYRIRPDLGVAIFEQFNLLILARSDRQGQV